MATLRLKAVGFHHGGDLPEKHTKHGGNLAPQLVWESIPYGTASMVLVCVGTNSLATEPYVHWVSYNIEPSLPWYSESDFADHDLFTQGINSSNTVGYDGPRTEAAKLDFTIYALDCRVNSKEALTWKELEPEIEECKTLATATLTVHYAPDDLLPPNKKGDAHSNLKSSALIGAANFDLGLVGSWSTIGSDGYESIFEIEESGQWHGLSEIPFEISTDGQTMELPKGKAHFYQRISGSGASLVGKWKRRVTSHDLEEEIAFFSNGSYKSDIWIISTGASGGTYVGSYVVAGDKLERREEFCTSTTDSDELTCMFDHPTNPRTVIGFYKVATNGDSWTWTIPDEGGTQIVYTKVS